MKDLGGCYDNGWLVKLGSVLGGGLEAEADDTIGC